MTATPRYWGTSEPLPSPAEAMVHYEGSDTLPLSAPQHEPSLAAVCVSRGNAAAFSYRGRRWRMDRADAGAVSLCTSLWILPPATARLPWTSAARVG
jgi:hypothetical protein